MSLKRFQGRFNLSRAISVPVLAGLYLLAIILAESTTNLVSPFWGTLLHMTLFVLLLFHAAFDDREPVFALLLALALVPLIRIISLSLPLGAFSQEWWYVVTGVPLIAASIAAARALGFSRRDVGFRLPARGTWLLTIIAVTSGVLIGAVEYGLLGPAEVSPEPNLGRLLFYSAALVFGSGITEELIFRGVLQITAVAALGVGPGILYSSVLFAAMHMGHGSMPHIVFILAVAIFFGVVRHRTGSLLGVIVAHSLTNVMFFIVLPL